MCGICGILNINGEPISKDRLLQMNDAMYLRGPDDAGHYIDRHLGLAMRRLSIIDLEGGHQPIANEDGSIVVVLNGEIYNYIELREDLIEKGHVFSTRSDTEVIVHLYEEYGTQAVEHLNGMFAFALWDRNLERLWVARDRLGIKPLVYFEYAGGFAFASSLDALIQHHKFERNIDTDSLLLFFMLAYVPTPRAIWKKAKKLPPGHMLVIEKGVCKLDAYWQLSPLSIQGVSENPFVEQVHDLFKDSIHLQARSDVPVGALLSGGIDSGSITALFCEQSSQAVHTFTMDFEGKKNNEGDFARLVADKYHTQHHLLHVDVKSSLDTLDILSRLMDEPMADSAIVPSYLLSQAASEAGVKVVLCGAGGDELYGGYSRHFPGRRDIVAGRTGVVPAHILASICVALPPKAAHAFALSWDKGLSFATSTSGVQLGLHARHLKGSSTFARSMKLMREQFTRLSKDEKKWGYAYARMVMDTQQYLVDNVLAISDRTSMAASVEARVPLLDHRLVEHAFSVSAAVNIGNSSQNKKKILKKAMGSYLHQSLLQRPKMGFNGPVNDWIRQGHPSMKNRILSPQSSVIQELFDSDAVKKTWMNSKLRQLASENLFMIYCADLWLEKHE
jgi:asparagine synthase (glutamine-hydrolysing)